ncbi:EamA family transporter [Salinisphaera sp. SPP-AMP-43]|uniref:EamA family transporter n=1 Tax=Salinisphaera sp. SPP-AMP-43 TaxID=3121288 RepID=UPI003C6E7437
MTSERKTALASLTIVLAGCIWGLYWLPVRALEQAGLGGALGSLAVVVVALVLVLPLAWRRRDPRGVDYGGAAATAVGGTAFMLYSVGLVEGRIASVILLFYLTPVWTTLIEVAVLRWPVPWLRYPVILLGLIGLGLVLGADGGWPLPRAAGEWLGLLAGLLWSLGTIGMRARPELRPLSGTTFFLLGALLAGLLLWATLPTTAAIEPNMNAGAIAWLVAAALVWWSGSMLALVWAAARLEPARVGILLMSEVLVGVVSAALWAGETMVPIQMLGASLLVAAGVLDALLG